MKYILGFVYIGLVTCLYASPVDTNVAQTIAQRFMQTNLTAPSLKNMLSMHLVHQEVSTQKDAGNFTYYYVYNMEPKGYVIVSGNDNVLPVLGYSHESSFNPEQIPVNMKSFLSEVKREIAYIIEYEVEASVETRQAWNQLLAPTQQQQKETKSGVAPLIKTKWSQSPFYNDLCPLDSNSNRRAVTGCVATAMAQVINYWKYPEKGFSHHSYVHEDFGPLQASFENTNYRYDLMPVELRSTTSSDSVNAVATLMFHCGVAVEMNYGINESGAYLDEYTVGKQSAEYALRTYFAYSNLKSEQRFLMGDQAWIALLKSQLQAGQPVLYRGQGGQGGHAFVCDGYDANNFFHFNWGWGGSSDGYFAITSLNPGAYYDFTSYQGAVYDIIAPNQSGDFNLVLFDQLNLSASSVQCETPFVLTTKVLNNGSLPFKGEFRASIVNTSGNEIIELGRVSILDSIGLLPDTDTSISFSSHGVSGIAAGAYKIKVFYRKDMNQEWHVVTNVGHFVNEKVITFVGDIVVVTDSVRDITAQSVSLHAHYIEGCAQIVAMGFKWKKESDDSFITAYAEDSVFDFTLTQLEPQTSYICIPFVNIYTGSTYGTVFGTEISFTTASLALEQRDFPEIKIYPNPVKEKLNIENLSENEPVHMQLFNITGQLMYACQLSESGSQSIAVDTFAKGVYFLRFLSRSGVICKKVIIE